MNRIAPHSNHKKSVAWPLVLIALFFGIVINFLAAVLPFRSIQELSFFGWSVPLLGAIGTWMVQRKEAGFPLALWVPWVLWVVVYLVYATAENAFQRSLMLITPLAIGVACSKLTPNEWFFSRLSSWLDRFTGIFVLAAFSAAGLIAVPYTIGWSSAAGTITAGLLGAWLAVRYTLTHNRRYLLAWVLVLCIPVLFVTRTGIVAVAVTLPLVLAPWPLVRRLLVLGALAVAGMVVFQMENIQSKMFHSGQGTLQEAINSATNLVLGKTEEVSSDFRTNARQAMRDRIRDEVGKAYWLGHGANAVEKITQEFDGLTHPHNDWLRLQHDYGTIGMLLFGIILLAQMLHAWRASIQLKGEAKLFMLTGAGAFIPMALFMLTDNVILYVAWFGNIQFAMLGLGYAALRQQRLDLVYSSRMVR